MNKQDTIVDEALQKLIDKRNHILNLQRQLNTQNNNKKLSREEKNEVTQLKRQENKLVSKIIEHSLTPKEATQLEKQFQSLEAKLLQQLGQSNPQTLNTIKEPEIAKNIDIYTNLDKYFEEYLEYRIQFDGIKNSSIKSYKAAIKYLKYFINDKTDFSFKFFKDIQKNFQLMPKNFFKYKKYYTLSFKELIKLKEKEQYDTLDNQTINNHISAFKKFFDYLKYEEVITINPLLDIRPLPETKETNKKEYTSEELSTIFNSDIDKEYKNMCKVALYAGLRIEEVLSIKKENIKDGLIEIDIEDSSTKKHQRLVPVHENLKLSINQQIKQNKGKFLFFNGNVNNEVKNVGKRINRRLKKLVDIEGKTFHSFRKNFSQEIELKTDAEEKYKKYLMGHSQSKDITHMIYNRGKVNIDKLNNCINQITFDY
jgi:integrase